MIDNVKKRDGRIVKFDPNKIQIAISKANKTVLPNYRLTDTEIANIAEQISNENKDCITVEQIQDIVERKLMESGHVEVAKNYILYRNERTKEREKNGSIVKRIMRLRGKVKSYLLFFLSKYCFS